MDILSIDQNAGQKRIILRSTLRRSCNTTLEDHIHYFQFVPVIINALNLNRCNIIIVCYNAWHAFDSGLKGSPVEIPIPFVLLVSVSLASNEGVELSGDPNFLEQV